MNDIIRLSPSEIIHAAAIGAWRFAESIANSRRDNHGFDKEADGLSIHILGACGELAAAKFKGWDWIGNTNSFKQADLASSIQVRTRSKHDYDLIVRDDDDDASIFVLVTGVAPEFRIRGWIYGRDAKQECYRQSYGGRPPAYFVPASELRPPRRDREAA